MQNEISLLVIRSVTVFAIFHLVLFSVCRFFFFFYLFDCLFINYFRSVHLLNLIKNVHHKHLIKVNMTLVLLSFAASENTFVITQS